MLLVLIKLAYMSRGLGLVSQHASYALAYTATVLGLAC